MLIVLSKGVVIPEFKGLLNKLGVVGVEVFGDLFAF
jgi:hypothetical protein